MFFALSSWVMPITATGDGSTDNGASSIAAAIARTHMPTYPTSSQTNDHESAPDNRALAADIRAFGGLWLDDWKMPRSTGHILSREKLQTLATGGGLKVGKVMENEAETTKLTECFVINTKCVQLPPDLINRSVFFFAGKVSEEQKGNIDVAAALTEGRVAIEIRFATLNWIRWLDLDTVIPVSTPIRFPLFATIAMKFAAHRGIPNPAEAVAAAWKFAGEYQQVHYRQAEDSGLVNQVENRRSIVARVIDLFSGASHEDMDVLRGYFDGRTISVLEVATGRCWVRHGERASISALRCLQDLGIGAPPEAKQPAVVVAYNEDAKRVMPNVGDEFVVHPGNGTGQWKLRRVADNGSTPRFKLIPPDALK